MRSGLILTKVPQRTATGKITMVSRWIKPRDVNVSFPYSSSRHNNSTYIDALKYAALGKIKSDLFLIAENKENILTYGLALDEQYGASYGKYGLAIYLTETPNENKENLLLKGNIENPLIIRDLDTLHTPEDIFIFNIINVNGDPEGDKYLADEFTKKILTENIDCVIWKEKEDSLFHFAVYNPGHLRIVIDEKNE